MKGEKVCGILVAATALAVVAYAGNGVYSRGEPVRQEEVVASQPVFTTVATAPPETEPPTATTQPQPDPTVTARLETAMAGMDGEHIFVYDVGLGQMLSCSGDPGDKLYPASITKLYTAWLALLYLSPDTVVTAGDEVSMVGGGSSLAYISRGCRLTVEMLVEAMLLPSGNDAAYVLAAAAGRVMAGDEALGSGAAVQRFVAEMNREADRLGMANSHFSNPDGYHTAGHYSCPGDMAIIGALALESDVILRYAGLEADSVTYASGEKITWYNTNRMINRGTEQYCADALGLKTGYTGEAGYCLLAAFGREGQRILVGIFGADRNYPRYENAATLWQCCGE